jgi:hypothetical protein
MELTGEMLYRMWLECGPQNPDAEDAGPVFPPWDVLTPEGRATFERLATKLEVLAE